MLLKMYVNVCEDEGDTIISSLIVLFVQDLQDLKLVVEYETTFHVQHKLFHNNCLHQLHSVRERLRRIVLHGHFLFVS